MEGVRTRRVRTLPRLCVTLWCIYVCVCVLFVLVASESPSGRQEHEQETSISSDNEREPPTDNHRHASQEPVVVYEIFTSDYDGSVSWEESSVRRVEPHDPSTTATTRTKPSLSDQQAFVQRMQATLDTLLQRYEEQGTHVVEGEQQTILELKKLIEEAAPIMTPELLQELPELYEQFVDAQTMADEIIEDVKSAGDSGRSLLSHMEPSDAYLDVEDLIRAEGLTDHAVEVLEALAWNDNDVFAHEALAFLKFFEPNASNNRNFDTAFAHLRIAADGGLGVSSSLLGMFSLIDFGEPRNSSLDVVERRQLAEQFLLDLAREQEFTASMVVAYRMLRGESDGWWKGDACQNAVRYYHRCAESNVQQLADMGSQRPYELMRLSEEALAVGGTIDDLNRDAAQQWEYWRSLAGNPMDEQWAEATQHLGEMYFYGDEAAGVPQDFEQATDHFRRAAEAGEPIAQANYGMMLAQGIGTKQDNETALHYLKLAAAQGNGFAMHGVGLMYMSGAGVEKDEAKAVEYFRKAIDLGYIEAHTYLGTAYLHGRGVPRNETLAFEHYSEAATTESAQALFDLGVMYYRGAGTRWSCSKSLELFRRVATDPVLLSDLPFSMERAYDCYKQGDYVRAYLQYRLLAEFGSEEAQTNAAFLLEQFGDDIFPSKTSTDETSDHPTLWMGDPKHPLAEALALYERAAALNDTEAMRKTGSCYYEGWSGVCVKNATKAMIEYEKAAALGDAEAAFNCGAMYATGDGVARDLASATRFFAKCSEAVFPENVPCALALQIVNFAVSIHGAVDRLASSIPESLRLWSSHA